ncbi:MAG: response regulator [Candidatus Sumerlaeia bacterium]|nr:response regulator [Candidatus Sumerlaeia bacterium]
MARKVRILVVDPDPMTLERLNLLAPHAQTTVARTGLAALSHFPEQSFDLALISARLPDMSGVALCAALALLQPDLRRILLSDGDDFDDINDSLDRLGISGVLLRPLAAEGVREELSMFAA